MGLLDCLQNVNAARVFMTSMLSLCQLIDEHQELVGDWMAESLEVLSPSDLTLESSVLLIPCNSSIHAAFQNKDLKQDLCFCPKLAEWHCHCLRSVLFSEFYAQFGRGLRRATV
jgi:hypothetical protein